MQLNEPLVHAAICAAATGGQWQRALQLLADLREQRLVPRSASYNVAIEACAAAREPSVALRLLREMGAEGHPITLTPTLTLTLTL